MSRPYPHPFLTRRGRLPRRSLVPLQRQSLRNTVILQDSFTDTDNLDLPSHTPDIAPSGSTWNNPNLKIYNNEVHINYSDRPLTIIQSAISDCTISIRCSYDPNGNNSTTSEFRSGIIARYSDGGNFWRIAFNPLANFSIYEIKASFAVLRSSASFSSSAGIFHTVRAVLSGASISATLDTLYPIAYHLATHNQTATKHGFMIGFSGSLPAADDFLVECL